MGREIRRVPKNWNHPQRVNPYRNELEYRPMVDYDFKECYKDYEKDLAEWYSEQEAFENGKTFSYKDRVYSKANGNTYEDWSGGPPEPPNPYDFMPKGSWYQLFENVSEGTPLSPPFKTKEELVEWLVNNKDYWDHQWTRPQAEGIVKSESVPSMIMDSGKLYTAEQTAEFLIKRLRRKRKIKEAK